MRLIDADKLKYKFEINFSKKPEAQAIYQHLIDIVDDCPTVKTYCYFCGQTEHGQIEDRTKGEWVPVSEKLPEEKINPNTNDFVEVLCSTVFGNVRVYKYGKPMGYSKAHFWDWGEIMDEYVKAWQPLPEPYKEGSKK